MKNVPKINGRIYLVCRGELTVKNGVTINSGKDYNTIGGDSRTNLLVSRGAKLEIGANVGISNSTIVCRHTILIGDDVLIGGGCKLYDTDFHSIDATARIAATLRRARDFGATTAPIVIKRGAWIGGHCIILKGVTIGECSIVGAGSVVTKDIGPYEIWAGNPARFVRKTCE